jgi:hypothetical protein
MCESIKPPAVGSGCSIIKVATGALSTGKANSATSSNPSAVLSVSGIRLEGNSTDERISI